jgi:hypothetical protein
MMGRLMKERRQEGVREFPSGLSSSGSQPRTCSGERNTVGDRVGGVPHHIDR